MARSRGPATGASASRAPARGACPISTATGGMSSMMTRTRKLCAIATFFMSALRSSAAAMTKESAPGMEASSAVFRSQPERRVSHQ
jgi:hypothetical protein